VVVAHLRTNHSTAIVSLTNRQLSRMIAVALVIEPHPIPHQGGWEVAPCLPVSPVREESTIQHLHTLARGKVTVVTGVDYFKSDASLWTVLGAGVLEGERVTLLYEYLQLIRLQ